MTTDPLTKNNVTRIGNPKAKQAIVFVHGFGTDQSAWSEVAAPFLNDFEVVLFDSAGAGKSAPEAFVQHRYLNLHAYADDLLDVCAALRLKNTILVGHSVGGMVCVLATLKQPELAERLVLIGASPRYRNDANYFGGFTDDDLNGLYDRVLHAYNEWTDQFAAMAMANPGKPELSAYFAETLKSIPNDRALTVLCSIFQSDHRAELSKLEVPTLLVQSKQDIAVPLEVAEYMHRQIKNSQLSVINATGHFPHISAPAEVIAAMSPFIGAHL